MIGATGLLKGNKSETTTEEGDMSIDNMVKALKEANAYKDGMSDEEVKNAYGKLNMGDKKEEKKEEPKGNSETEQLLAAINALTAKVDSLESQLNAQEQAEKDALVAEVNALETGIAEDELKALSVNSLVALKEKHAPVTFGVNGQFRQSDNSSDDAFADIN
jgi:Skp family chaperone for outer membrane proteins